MDDSGVFGDRQIGAQRQFLEHAADTQVMGDTDVVRAAFFPMDDDVSGIRFKGPGEHVHQGRLTRAVMADKPQAFARLDRQVDADQGADRAEAFADPLQADDTIGPFLHPDRPLPLVSYCCPAADSRKHRRPG